MEHIDTLGQLVERFRGFLPVVIDVETGGFNAKTDALLEVGAALLKVSDCGELQIDNLIQFSVEPFANANVERTALEFTGIDLEGRRDAVPELEALSQLFDLVRQAVSRENCSRAILVGHNAHFDLGFINAAAKRCQIKRNPFHPFSCFDTATLSGLAYGQTVLAKACELAGLEFDNDKAHSAIYDAKKTADLFCTIVNRWQAMGGWPVVGHS